MSVNVAQATALVQAFTVVGCQNNRGRITHAEFFESVLEFAKTTVHVLDFAVIQGFELRPLAGVHLFSAAHDIDQEITVGEFSDRWIPRSIMIFFGQAFMKTVGNVRLKRQRGNEEALAGIDLVSGNFEQFFVERGAVDSKTVGDWLVKSGPVTGGAQAVH